MQESWRWVPEDNKALPDKTDSKTGAHPPDKNNRLESRESALPGTERVFQIPRS